MRGRFAIMVALASMLMSCRTGRTTISDDAEQQTVSYSKLNESSTVADDSVSERMFAVLDSIDLWLVPEVVTGDDAVTGYKPARLKARRMAVGGTRVVTQKMSEQEAASSESTASHSKELRRQEAATVANPVVNVAAAVLALLALVIVLKWNK